MKLLQPTVQYIQGNGKVCYTVTQAALGEGGGAFGWRDVRDTLLEDRASMLRARKVQLEREVKGEKITCAEASWYREHSSFGKLKVKAME